MEKTIKEILEDKKKAEIEAKKNKPKTPKVIRFDEKLQLRKSY